MIAVVFERERYLILKKSRHGTQVLCTVSNEPKWCYIKKLDGELVRSYSSEPKAMQAFNRHFGAKSWNPKRHRVAHTLERHTLVTERSAELKEFRARADAGENLDDTVMRWGVIVPPQRKKPPATSLKKL